MNTLSVGETEPDNTATEPKRSMTARRPHASPSHRRTIDDLDADICRVARHLNAGSYRLLVLVREFDERLGWAKWSFPNCAEWFAWRCGLSLSAAREKVRTAHALRDLPQISAAFRDGRLSYSKVRALTRAAQISDEGLLLAYALQATAAQVEERCRQIRNVAPESAEAAGRAWQGRSLSVWRNVARGTLTLRAEVPIDEGELVTRALDRAVDADEAAGGPEFGSVTWQAQQADALISVAKAYLGGSAVASAHPAARSGGDAAVPADTAGGSADGPATSVDDAKRSADVSATGAGRPSTADHYQVVVHVDHAALRGSVGRSDLAIETVKRLTCDGSLVTVAEDERGTPLLVGRKHRTVGTQLKRALWARDRACSFPGCHRTRYVDAHHVRHWADGGNTSLENLMLLCSYHHRLLHEGGFRIGHAADGTAYFQRRDGRVIPRFGYCADDALTDAPLTDDPSAEAPLAAIVRGRPSSRAFDATAPPGSA
jgi:Domain of unknown function (DUF222)/HNH endonuclease